MTDFRSKRYWLNFHFAGCLNLSMQMPLCSHSCQYQEVPYPPDIKNDLVCHSFRHDEGGSDQVCCLYIIYGSHNVLVHLAISFVCIAFLLVYMASGACGKIEYLVIEF